MQCHSYDYSIPCVAKVLLKRVSLLGLLKDRGNFYGRSKIINVVKEFEDERKGKVRAVNDANFTVKDKEFLVFVGPSGCGKTTSLRMIAGLERQSSGDIYIGNRLVNKVHPKDRDIAMVFQDYALYPHMTIKENLAFGLKNLKNS